jgi:hypothetical protein
MLWKYNVEHALLMRLSPGGDGISILKPELSDSACGAAMLLIIFCNFTKSAYARTHI